MAKLNLINGLKLQNINEVWNYLGWQPSESQVEKFCLLQSLLKEENQKVNLTRLVNGNDFWINQILDSLWPIQNELKDDNFSKKVIDVGTGCGLPGLAIAIAMPKAEVWLIDSIIRKTCAIQKITHALNLNKRVQIITKRIEIVGQEPNFRESFDIALARAVSSAPVVAEYLVPLVKLSGEALLYKGKWSQESNDLLQEAIVPLNATIKNFETLELPDARGTRSIIRLVKIKSCPQKYPRRIGTPTKKPLGTKKLF